MEITATFSSCRSLARRYKHLMWSGRCIVSYAGHSRFASQLNQSIFFYQLTDFKRCLQGDADEQSQLLVWLGRRQVCYLEDPELVEIACRLERLLARGGLEQCSSGDFAFRNAFPPSRRCQG